MNWKWIMALPMLVCAGCAQGMNGTDDGPGSGPDAPQQTGKRFNVNVYIENSASMDGYVKGPTEFETAIYELLADIKLQPFCDSLNLNYINSTVIKHSVNAGRDRIEDYIQSLEPASFKARGGNRGTTDIKRVIHDVAGRVDQRNVAILISDFIPSLGKDKDATEHLDQLRVGIRFDLSARLKAHDLAMAVIQCESRFNGTYYDKSHALHAVDGQRPYYIWVMGTRQQIAALRPKVLEDVKRRSGYKNMAFFSRSGKGLAPAPAVQYGKWKEGTYAINVSKGITGAEWDRKTKHFGFTVAIDLADTWLEDDHLLNVANYRVQNPRYVIKGVRRIPTGDPLHGKHTHLIELRTAEPKPLLPEETVRVELLARMPAWVAGSSSVDDTGIKGSATEMRRTLGLMPLLEGVHQAFHTDPEGCCVASFSIPIKKK